MLAPIRVLIAQLEHLLLNRLGDAGLSFLWPFLLVRFQALVSVGVEAILPVVKRSPPYMCFPTRFGHIVGGLPDLE